MILRRRLTLINAYYTERFSVKVKNKLNACNIIIAFAIAGPTVWNSLPDELKDPARGSDSFKQFLKGRRPLV